MLRRRDAHLGSQTGLAAVLDSERRRATLTAWVFAMLAGLLGVVLLIPGAWPEKLYESIYRLMWPMGLLFAGMLVYELVLRFRIRRLMQKSHLPGWVFRYSNALIEITVPTVILIMLAQEMGHLQALSSAAPLLYPLFVGMTVLYLDRWVSLFAGAVAALQFGWVAWYYLHGHPIEPGTELLAEPSAYVIKSALVFASGLVAGFLAAELKKQLVHAVHHAEERDHAVSVFGQHVSPEIAERLLRQKIEITGEEREACVMFLDIRDFSKLASGKSPAEVMTYLNLLFGEFIDIVNAHRGIVNKFLGDGFMAVFGAPVEDMDKCSHGVDAAREIISCLQEMNARGDIPPTRVGIGLHVGRLVTGNVGTSTRKEYTLIGETVNVASRIEEATKQFDASLLVSGNVLERASGMGADIQDLGLVELKGQRQAVRLYKLA
jgi:adenylate cyclase